jgi:hypothetical protein
MRVHPGWIYRKPAPGLSDTHFLPHWYLLLPDPDHEDETEIESESNQATILIPWLLQMAIQAANNNQSCAASRFTLAAQLLGSVDREVKP